MPLVTLNPFKQYYHTYLLIWYLLYLFLSYDKLHLFIGLMSLSPVVMLFYFWLQDRSREEKPLKGYHLRLFKKVKPGYLISGDMLNFSMLLFVGVCVFGKVMSEELAPVFLTLILVFILVMTTAIYFFAIDSSVIKSEMGVGYKSLFTLIFRSSWLFVFFVSYVMAKNIMMEVMDITFEAAATKITVILLACIYFAFFYFTLIMFASIFLTLLEKREVITSKSGSILLNSLRYLFYC